MKLLRYSSLAVVVVALSVAPAGGQYFGGGGFGQGDSHTLTIRPDGSCAMTNASIMPRKSLEAQVTSWERYSKMAKGTVSEDENAPPAPPQPAKPEQKTLSNEELAAKLREMYQQRSNFGGEDGLKIEKLEVSTNTVQLVTQRDFASLKELLSESVHSWGLLSYDEVRFETDTNRNLRISFHPLQDATRYTKNIMSGWKAARTKYEWKLMLPGKILSSGLPATEGNQTWLPLDGEKQETLDAALKLMAAPLVITAEAGGIQLDEPLESKKLVRAAWRLSNPEPDLPITDAGAGFLAEPVSLNLSTIHYFPEGKKHFKNGPEVSTFGMETPGTVVSAKLFPPKGRLIKSVSGLRVKAAKDDKGRAISTSADDSDTAESYSEFAFSSDQPEKGGAARVQLRLGVPAPDAKTIEELNCEAVALTMGGWKEMVLTNVQADAKKEIDLGEVLPGAKLIVKKISGKSSQTTIEARLEGPAAVNQLDVRIKLGGRRGGSSNISNQRNTTSGKQTTRNVTIHAYEYAPGDGAKSPPPTLLVRYPQDMKRERVNFKLTTLDLL